ncbi:hypothetical protein EGR_10443 [Echinococcus granulosus]|uniref:Uncharacterized protein n=1 Tax=Echinococcus granulosus TaxID=6210 RepID=W6U0Y6_ECHGR|nr:hypothetical protein EGR_10443 [Echinococcus granulosus]EUB54703.1 hypothetical protein EGR_10443 [Echinococcus granulosus]
MRIIAIIFATLVALSLLRLNQQKLEYSKKTSAFFTSFFGQLKNKG